VTNDIDVSDEHMETNANKFDGVAPANKLNTKKQAPSLYFGKQRLDEDDFID
jgi:hypothetical protein